MLPTRGDSSPNTPDSLISYIYQGGHRLREAKATTTKELSNPPPIVLLIHLVPDGAGRRRGSLQTTSLRWRQIHQKISKIAVQRSRLDTGGEERDGHHKASAECASGIHSGLPQTKPPSLPDNPLAGVVSSLVSDHTEGRRLGVEGHAIVGDLPSNTCHGRPAKQRIYGCRGPGISRSGPRPEV